MIFLAESSAKRRMVSSRVVLFTAFKIRSLCEAIEEEPSITTIAFPGKAGRVTRCGSRMRIRSSGLARLSSHQTVSSGVVVFSNETDTPWDETNSGFRETLSEKPGPSVDEDCGRGLPASLKAASPCSHKACSNLPAVPKFRSMIRGSSHVPPVIGAVTPKRIFISP